MRIDMIIQLQGEFDPDQFHGDTGLAALVALHAQGKLLRAEYEALRIPVPEWLDDRIRTLSREVESKRTESVELRLRQIAARRAQLKTRDEERADLAREEEELRAQLAAK